MPTQGDIECLASGVWLLSGSGRIFICLRGMLERYRNHGEPRTAPLPVVVGAAVLAFLAFIRITRQLMGGDVVAMHMSALGSVTLVVLFSALALLLLLILRDRMGALQEDDRLTIYGQPA